MKLDKWKKFLNEYGLFARNKEAFWGTNTLVDPKLIPGFEVPKSKGKHGVIESMFDKIRKEIDLDFPSRIGANFVCETLTDYIRNTYMFHYKVKFSGNYRVANIGRWSNVYEEALLFLRFRHEFFDKNNSKDVKYLEDRFNDFVNASLKYIKNEPYPDDDELIINPGKVIVLKRIE